MKKYRLLGVYTGNKGSMRFIPGKLYEVNLIFRDSEITVHDVVYKDRYECYDDLDKFFEEWKDVKIQVDARSFFEMTAILARML